MSKRRLILNADNRSPDAEGYWKYMIQITQEYCKKWATEFKFVSYESSLERHPSWERIKLLKTLIADYDEILWLDTDASIINHNVDVFNYLKTAPESSTWIRTPDSTPVIYAVSNKPYTKFGCAGIFLLDCSDKSRAQEVLDSWWTDVPDEKYIQGHPWEQTVWHHSWTLNETKRSWIRVADIWTTREEEKGQVFIHLVNTFKRKRLHEARKYYKRIFNQLTTSCQKRVGIFITKTSDNRTAVYLRLLLEAQGHNVFFLTSNLPLKDCVLGPEYPYFIFNTDEINIDDYCQFVCVTHIPSVSFLSEAKKKNIRLAYYLKDKIPDDIHLFHEIWYDDSLTTDIEYLSLPKRKVPICYDPIMNLSVLEEGETDYEIVILGRNLNEDEKAFKFAINLKERNLNINKIHFFHAPKLTSIFQNDYVKDRSIIVYAESISLDEILNHFKRKKTIFLSLHKIPNLEVLEVVQSGFRLIHEIPQFRKEYGCHYDDLVDFSIDSMTFYRNKNVLQQLSPFSMKFELFHNVTKEFPDSQIQFILLSASKEREEMFREQHARFTPSIPLIVLHPIDPPNYVSPTENPKWKRIMYCSRSHNRALEYASRDTSCDFSVVFEDDVAFHTSNFYPSILEFVQKWDKLVSPKKMASVGWIPLGNYHEYATSEEPMFQSVGKKSLECIPGSKIMNNTYVVGTQAYIVRKCDLSNELISLLIQPTYVDMAKKIWSKKIPSLKSDEDIASCDYLLPRILGQVALFPPSAIELQTPSLIGHEQEKYWKKYFDGYEQLRDKYFKHPTLNCYDYKVCIVGCARNVENFIDKTIDKMLELHSKFNEKSVILIAENGSTDSTKEKLRNFEKEYKFFKAVMLDDMIQMTTMRTQRIAAARNCLLEIIHRDYLDYDFFLNIDVDNIISNLETSQVIRAITETKEEWSALFANSNGPYYDVWALKSADCPYDCWDMVHHTKTKDAVKDYIGIHQKIINSTSDTLIPVESAFGGLGIYKIKDTLGCKYSGLTRECECVPFLKDVSVINKECRIDTCEHRAFHNDMKRLHNAKLWIVPSLLVNSVSDHIHNSSELKNSVITTPTISPQMELIDLRKIKTVFICPDHNDKYKERCKYMMDLLDKLGFENFVHYKSGSNLHDKFPLNLATYNILQMNLNEPVLILEDDLEFVPNPKLIFEIPANVDAVYLGIHGCNFNFEKYVNEGHAKFEIVNSEYARVLNMLGTHAILYNSQSYKSFISSALKTCSIPNDVEICKHQSKFNLLALRKPICWQSSKLNNNWKWIEYATNIQITDSGLFKTLSII